MLTMNQALIASYVKMYIPWPQRAYNLIEGRGAYPQTIQYNVISGESGGYSGKIFIGYVFVTCKVL